MACKDPVPGEYVNVWGHRYLWTEDHPTRAQLAPLKQKYDELAGNAYTRALEIFREEQEKIKGPAPADQPAPKPNVFNIVKEHHATDPVLGALWTQVNTVPDWVDWDQLERGQNTFYRYGFASFQGLAYQSLLGGFGAGKIVETLARTGGFSPAMARRRLFETAQWNLEVTKGIDSIKPGGQGWTSTVQVRLLHSAVRHRIVKLTETRPSYYDAEAWGIPVNDVDQAATIGSFSAAPIWMSLPRQGIYMREQEIIDYIALWRYLAYLIGAPTHFFENVEKARLFHEATLVYEIVPTDTSRLMAKNLVKGLENQPPLYPSADFIIAGARWLNGDQLMDDLGLHRPNLFYKAIIGFQMAFFAVVAYTCRQWDWLDRAQREWFRDLSWRMAVEDKNALGGKRTDFAFKFKPDHGKMTELHPSYAVARKDGQGAGHLWLLASLVAFGAAAYYVMHGNLPALRHFGMMLA